MKSWSRCPAKNIGSHDVIPDASDDPCMEAHVPANLAAILHEIHLTKISQEGCKGFPFLLDSSVKRKAVDDNIRL